jgi:uncharacterized damage-inducible protein DinB
MSDKNSVEPWLRATLTDVPPVQRAVLHALQLAHEDLDRWCAPLSDAELNATPVPGIPSVAFQLRHIARSLDRLLTYAEGTQLSAQQLSALKSELDPGATSAAVFSELHSALTVSAHRVSRFTAADLDSPRSVGKKALPTTVAGLLVHVADHTQRHVGQAITTSKLVKASGG